MAEMTVTNVDMGGPVLYDPEYSPDVLQFSGEDTYAAGTILARKAVADAVTVVDGTNTGDGTCTLATVAAGPTIPLAGAYSLACTEVVTDAGIFSLTDPNGAVVATSLAVTASTATKFTAAGLTFTITPVDSTDFIVGDSFALTVAADGDLVAFDVDGAGGAQIPKSILTYEVAVSTASDVNIRAAVSGKFVKERLIIDADGDDSNITNTVIDQLRNYGLLPVNVSELNINDNQ